MEVQLNCFTFSLNREKVLLEGLQPHVRIWRWVSRFIGIRIHWIGWRWWSMELLRLRRGISMHLTDRMNVTVRSWLLRDDRRVASYRISRQVTIKGWGRQFYIGRQTIRTRWWRAMWSGTWG